MSSLRIMALGLVVVLPYFAACGGDDQTDEGSPSEPSGTSSGQPGASSGSGAGASSGQPGASSGSSSGGTGPLEGSLHTPESGCKDGYLACGDVCSHVEDDSRHCGSCEGRCIDANQGCVEGRCVANQGCSYGKYTCGGECVDAPNAYHCGSCDNRCGAGALCVEGACLAQERDGTSCAAPLLWDVEDSEKAAFRMDTRTAPHTFECGPLAPIPTRWFRFTAPKNGSSVEVRGATGTDFVLELFSASSCDAPVRMACNDNADGLDPELDGDSVEKGKTYYVAVGLKSGPADASATLRIDH